MEGEGGKVKGGLEVDRVYVGVQCVTLCVMCYMLCVCCVLCGVICVLCMIDTYI